MLEDNLTALRERFGPLAGAVAAADTTGLAVLPARRTGVPTVCLDDAEGRFYLHSVFDPAAEADKFVEGVPDLAGKKVVLLYGFAMGYPVEAILRRVPSVELVMVVEPNLPLLRCALEHRDLGALLRDERFGLIAGSAGLIETALLHLQDALTALPGHATRLVVYGPSLRATPPGALGVRQLFEYLGVNDQVSRKHPLGMDYERNRDRLFAEGVTLGRGISVLRDCAGDVPAVLVGAGPSLDTNVQALRAVGDRALIVVVDVALRALLAAGVQPHVVMTLDPQFEMRFLEGCEGCGGLLVHGAGTPVELLSLFPAGRRVLFLREEEVGGAHFAAYGPADVLPKRPNVFLAGLALLEHMGVDRIILAGSDLAVRPGATHTRHAGDVGMAMDAWDQLREVPGYHGEPVRTTMQFYVYLRFLEQHLVAHPALTVINATEGGAHIRGTRQATLEQALAQWLPQEDQGARCLEVLA